MSQAPKTISAIGTTWPPTIQTVVDVRKPPRKRTAAVKFEVAVMAAPTQTAYFLSNRRTTVSPVRAPRP